MISYDWFVSIFIPLVVSAVWRFNGVNYRVRWENWSIVVFWVLLTCWPIHKFIEILQVSSTEHQVQVQHEKSLWYQNMREHGCHIQTYVSRGRGYRLETIWGCPGSDSQIEPDWDE